MGKCKQCGREGFDVPYNGYCEFCQAILDRNKAEAEYWKKKARAY